MRKSTNSLFVVLIGCGLVSEALPCSPAQPLPSPGELVDTTPVIIHVRAVGLSNNPEKANEPASSETLVDFEVIENVKGWISDRVISFEGHIVSRDDFNDVSMPYGFVRPGGRAGNCYALNYRLGSHYLLFLREADDGDGLTPYWSPLAPVNEQIRGPRDSWLLWVKLRMNGRR